MDGELSPPPNSFAPLLHTLSQHLPGRCTGCTMRSAVITSEILNHTLFQHLGGISLNAHVSLKFRLKKKETPAFDISLAFVQIRGHLLRPVAGPGPTPLPCTLHFFSQVSYCLPWDVPTLDFHCHSEQHFHFGFMGDQGHVREWNQINRGSDVQDNQGQTGM